MATQPLSDRMRAFFAHVDAHEEEFVNRLRECVAIPGVSAEPARRPDVIRTMHWTKEWLDRLGAETRLVDIGTQPLPDGSSIPLPPVLLAQFGTNPDNNTVCVYGHLDVQPAAKEDGWDTEPFELTEVDGALFGRGSTDDKGPVLGTLCALQSFLELDLDVLSRLNVKLLLEGMEESGSVGIPELIEREARPGGFLSDVSCFLISDNYWLGRSKPCLTYGLRGMAYFWLTVEGGARDLHSGVFGGTVFEPMTDLVKLMGTLVDTQGRIQVAGIMDDVAPLTEEERRRYHGIDFDLESFKSDAGVAGRVLHEDTSALLMHRWRFPTLSLHGIEGAFAGAGCKTVLPRKVIGKFSIRLVPDMAPERVLALVEAHLRAEFEKLGRLAQSRRRRLRTRSRPTTSPAATAWR